MAKQLNVDLNFKANTSQAQRSIMELQSMLSKIAVGNGGLNIDPSKMKAASEAAKELSIHLNNAFNAETGNFDLSKLDRSLKTSSTNITELSSKLLNAGASGEQAFVKLAQTIAAADRPVVTLNSKLSGLMTTLKNTARWQISSSILHGFMGAVQQAYGYAQDLNASLNDIRIVSGQNTEQMAKFADEANKAAKNLSTTTTAYTKAALIFYQQGDKGSTITEKADVVTKMSNVTGQNTTVVSDQLTAIWNNFNKAGDESYEHYADVLTALGAATASSTDEIAGGLEKFAGIAETVGLSYDYAAAALATITATSRESEDVVGTALKTIFSRIQGLNLGETLDDGTDMNKYSEALMKVGISIKDQTGQIKEMDTILDEMGAKWKTLSNDQQMALAQTVAGVRQYNQLMTLMNNWDFMQQNVNVAKDSDGALQKQQEIYEESWQAANNRVRASMEAIYSDIIDDEFFIDITNGFSALIDSVDAFIDGAGGIKTILIGIGSIFLSNIANKITPALQNLKHTFSIVFQSAEQQAKALATEMNSSISKVLNTKQGQGFSDSSQIALKNAMQLNEAKAKMQAVENNLTAIEKQRYSQQLNMISVQQQETQEVADRITKLKEEKNAILDKAEATQLTSFGQENASQGKKEIDRNVDIYKQSMHDMVGDDGSDVNIDAAVNAYMRARDAAVQYQETQKVLIESTAQVDNAFRQMGDSLDLSNPTTQLDALNNAVQEAYGGALQDLGQRMRENKAAIEENATSFISFRNSIDLAVASMPEAVRESQQMQEALSNLYKAKDYDDLEKALDQIEQALKGSKLQAKDFAKVLKEINPKRYAELETNANKTKRALEDLRKKQNAVNEALKDFNPGHVASKIEIISKTASGLGQVAMAAQSVRSIFQAWNNDDLSIGEKITTTIMSISMAVPSAIGGLKTLANAILSTAGAQGLLAEAQALSSQMMAAEAVMLTMKTSKYSKAQLAIIANAMAMGTLSDAELLEFTMSKLNCDQKTAETVIEQLNGNMKKKNIITVLAMVVAKKLEAAASGLTAAAKAGETSSLWANVVAWIAAQAAMAPVLVVTLLITAAIAALVLIVWGLVAAFQAIQAASPEGQLNAAKQKAEELSSALESAKQAAEDLKAAFDGYDSAVEALENCTEGTQEWRDALREVNNEVLSLISEYPELASMTNETGEKAVTRGKNGELVVADWAKDRLMDNANQAITNTQTASIHANQDVREAQIKVDRIALANQINRESGTYGSKVSEYDGTTYDVSGQIARYITDHASELSGMTPEEQKAMLQSYFDANDITADTQSWVNAIGELGPQLGALAGAVEANTAATQVENEAIAANILAGEGSVQDSDHVEEITSIAAKDLDKSVDAEIQKLKDEGWGTDGISKADGVNDEARKIFAQYAKAAGIANYDLLDTTGTDGNRHFVYNDGDKEVTVSLEAMRSVVAASNANEQLAKNANQLVQTLSGKTDEEVSAITAAVTKNVNDLSVGQARGDFDVEKFAKNLSAEDLKAMGYEGDIEKMRADYIAAYNEVATNASSALNDIVDDYVDSVQTSMNSLKKSGALDDLTLGEADKLGAALEQAFTTGGTEGMKVLEGMFSEASAEGFGDEFINSLQGIDWSNITPDALAEHLKEAGVEITFADDKLQQLIKTMYDGGINIQGAIDKYKSLHDVINGLSTGDTISEEDFNKFDEYGIAAEDYFLRMADGTFKLIGDAEEFYNLVHQQSVDQFKSDIEQLNEQNDAYQNVLNYGVDTIQGTAARTYDGETGQLMLTESGAERASMQLDFLSSTDYNPAQIQEWREQIQKGTVDVNAIAQAVHEQTDALGGIKAAEEHLTNAMKANNETANQQKEMIAAGSETIAELDGYLQDGTITLEQYDKAYASVAAKEFDLDPTEVQEYGDALMKMAKAKKPMDGVADSLADNEKAIKKIAVSQKRMEKGISTLTNKWEGWDTALKEGNIGEQAAAVEEMRGAMADILDVDLSEVSEDFVTNAETMDLMKKAAEGDMEALNQLANAFAQQYVADISINNESFEGDLAGLQGEISSLISQFDATELEIGTSLDSSGYASAMTELMAAAGTDVNTINEILAGLGFEPQVSYVDIPVDQYSQMTSSGNTMWTDSEGNSYTAVLDTTLQANENGMVKVPVINGSKTTFKGGGSSAANSGSKKGGGGGGGGGKPQKVKATKKSDIVDRYKEVEDSLDNVRDKSEKVEKSFDNLYGEEQLAAIREFIELQKQEQALLEQKKSEAIGYLTEDYNELTKAAREAGVALEIDPDTKDILNYEDVLNDLYKQLRQKEGADGREVSEAEQKAIDDLKEKIEKLKEAAAQYDETKELLEDLNTELDEMKGKDPLPLIKSEHIDIYREVEDKLDNIEKQIDRIQRIADSKTGAERIKELQKIAALEKERYKILQEQQKLIQQDLDDKKSALDEMATKNGVTFTYDAETKDITNADEVMNTMWSQYEALYNELAADGGINEAEQAALDAMLADIEQLQEYIDGYREGVSEFEDAAIAMEESLIKLQELNYERITEALEYKIEQNEKDLELTEYYLGKIEDDLYSAAEAYKLMQEQAALYTDNLKQQEQTAAELREAYEKGEISAAQYEEAMAEMQSATIEQLQALEELKKSMQDYYGNIMSMAMEEIAIYTDEMDHLNSVLDHYSSIMGLVGKQEDYATKNKILGAKATNLQNEMAVQKKIYEESNAEAEKWAAKMATAVEGSVEYETYKKNWLAAKEVANQAQDAMLSKTEEWAQAIKEITENELAQLANTLEQSMTGGTSFDELLSQMDHRQSLQEEYLTTTNQIYETNKLMRNAQQEIDKSTNSVAKKRLKNFINETAEMQNQNKLSKYELSIQQAKYDLLLAQIALEEAQKAKSTVRLQRDSEGNFGYVYTADQSQVATAEQNLEDKQNALYNIGLNGANDYAQKYAQTMAEAQDEIEALTQAWMNGEIASEEEYQRRKSEIQEYYYAKLQDYSELYQVAVGVDGDIIKDSWSADFGEMTTSTDTWKKNVVTYFDEAAKAIEPWTQACQEVLEQTGLDDVAEAARVAAEESEALAETLLGEDGESGVVGAIMTEVEAAGNLSEAYISIQQAIDDTIKKYEEFLGVINQEYKEPAPPPLPEPEPPAPEEPPVEPTVEPKEEPKVEPMVEPKEEPKVDSEVGKPTWERVKEAYDKINRGDWRTGDDRYVDGLNNGFTDEEVALAQKLINYVYPRNKGGQGKSMDEAQRLLGFATGGYTGDWAGPYGKVAILHQKELVLNEQDTENLLASVDMLDRLMATIDLYAASAQLGSNLLSPSVEKYRQQEDILEQRVHIEATFPNVSDKNEIEEAFNNLINTASQYANRKL